MAGLLDQPHTDSLTRPLSLPSLSCQLRARFLKSGLQRLLSRMKDAINKAVKQDAAHHSTSQQRAQAAPVLEGKWSELADSLYPFDAVSRSSLSTATLAVLSPSLSFLRWLTHFLLDCQYPAAPYERHCAALEMLRLILACFNLLRESNGDVARAVETPSASLDSHLIRHAVLTPLLTASSVLILLAGVGRAWQSVRFLSYSILVSAFPSPLPGFTSFSSVRRLLEWSLSLSSSPRARDSEAGALAIKLVFIKYVRQLGWTVPLQDIAQCMQETRQQPVDGSVSSDWPISPSSASAVFFFLCFHSHSARLSAHSAPLHSSLVALHCCPRSPARCGASVPSRDRGGAVRWMERER